MFGTPLPSSTVDVITMKSATVNLRDGSQYDSLITSNAKMYLSTIAIGQVTSSDLTSTVAGLGSVPYLSSYAIYGSNDAGYVLKSTVQGLNTTLSTGYTTINSASISSMSQFTSIIQLQSTILFATGTAPTQSTIQYSYDGSNWNSISNGGFEYGANAIGYLKGIWVATGQVDGSASKIGSIQYSLNDGASWNSNVSGGFSGGSCVGTNNTLFFVGGRTQTDSQNGSIQYSTDVLHWNNNVSGGFQRGCSCFGWNGSLLLAGGGSGDGFQSLGAIQNSTDGSNWSSNITGYSDRVRGIAWNGSYWVSVGNGASQPPYSIQTSTDGIYWNQIASGGFIRYGSAVAWNGVMWVAVGTYFDNSFSNENIQYSYDGSNWFYSVSGAFYGGDDPAGNYFGGGTGIVWDTKNSIWVASGIVGTSKLNTLKYSYDGSNWLSSISGGFTGASIFRATSIAVKPYTFIYDISTNTLDFSLSGQQYATTPQHQIIASISTISLDNTLFVNKYTCTVGINTLNTTATLTVGRSAILENTLSVGSFLTISTISSIQTLSGYGRLYYNPTTKCMSVGTINP